MQFYIRWFEVQKPNARSLLGLYGFQPCYFAFSLVMHTLEDRVKRMGTVTNLCVNTQATSPSVSLPVKEALQIRRFIFFFFHSVEAELSVKKCVELPKSCPAAPSIWNSEGCQCGSEKAISSCGRQIEPGSWRLGVMSRDPAGRLEFLSSCRRFASRS